MIGLDQQIKTLTSCGIQIGMRNDHLAQFLTQTWKCLEGSQDSLTVHRWERFIEEEELWRTRDRPHKSLGKGETEAKGKPLQGAP